MHQLNWTKSNRLNEIEIGSKRLLSPPISGTQIQFPKYPWNTMSAFQLTMNDHFNNHNNHRRTEYNWFMKVLFKISYMPLALKTKTKTKTKE